MSDGMTEELSPPHQGEARRALMTACRLWAPVVPPRCDAKVGAHSGNTSDSPQSDSADAAADVAVLTLTKNLS